MHSPKVVHSRNLLFTFQTQHAPSASMLESAAFPDCPITDTCTAARLAQEVMNAWGASVKVGNAAPLTPQFKTLFETARRYRDAKSVGENHRKYNVLEAREDAEEKSTLQEFAEAYRCWARETGNRRRLTASRTLPRRSLHALESFLICLMNSSTSNGNPSCLTPGCNLAIGMVATILKTTSSGLPS